MTMCPIRCARCLWLLSVMIAALGVMTGLSSCVRDGREECEFPLRLRFAYTFNRENRDLLKEELHDIRMYLYDSATGCLLKSGSVDVDALPEDGTYEWRVPQGRHTLVCWAGVGGRYRIENEGHINSAVMQLGADNSLTVPPDREHLWHRLVTDVLVNGDETPFYDVDMHKLSNDIDVHVVFADGMAHLPVDVSVNASNALYSAYGNVMEDSPYVRYVSYDTGERQLLTVLTIDRGDDSRLHVVVGDNVIYSGSLTSLIASAGDVDFDLDDEFHISFMLQDSSGTETAVGVEVNGWHVMDYNVALK